MAFLNGLDKDDLRTLKPFNNKLYKGTFHVYFYQNIPVNGSDTCPHKLTPLLLGQRFLLISMNEIPL